MWLVEGGQEKSLAPLLGAMREEILAQLPSGVEAREVADGTIFGIDRPWSSFADEEEQKAWLAETLNAFVNVFRPLLKDLT